MRETVTKSENNGESAPNCSRRNFLKLVGLGGGALALSGSKLAQAATAPSGTIPNGVLVDTTLCVGCRSCEDACNQVNHLPKPDKAFDDASVLKDIRDTSPGAFTVVNRYATDQGAQVTRKQQCMHCLEPACSSACIIKALEKQPLGPVTYRDDLCLGCRYCMVSCPFDMPKFEYSKAVPLVKKCHFCFNLQEQDSDPACVEACPMEALKFGPRSELIEEAKKRIYTNPDHYVHHVYGEHEAGGTSWLYLANAPFEKLGLPKLSNKAYPELTEGAMNAVPVVMLVWPALLMGLHHFSHRKSETQEERSSHHVSREGDRR
jgi:Fe-S-cluster-containing dehydrogenase component